MVFQPPLPVAQREQSIRHNPSLLVWQQDVVLRTLCLLVRSTCQPASLCQKDVKQAGT